MFSKIKQFIGYPEDEFYDEDYRENLGDSGHGNAVSEPIADPQMHEQASHPSNPYNTNTPARGAQPNAASEASKVVQIHANEQAQVVLVKPERFEDASGIADHLNQKRTIILNLESANKDIIRRLIDFLSGVAYANNGQIRRVANNTYIITPFNVDIVGDAIDELENSGLFFV